MSKKKNKQGNKVVRDLKECFRSFNLPVNKLKGNHDDPMNVVFTSQLCNDQACAFVAVTFDRFRGYIGMDAAALRFKIPQERMGETLTLLNLLNEIRPICSYSVCPCCNTVSYRTALFLSGETLPVSKFRRLIQDMLEETYLCFPLISKVATDGNPKDLHARFMDDHKHLMSMESKLSQKAIKQILDDMGQVMANLKIPIHERLSDGFVTDLMLEGMDFPVRIGVTLVKEYELVTLSVGPAFTVPDDKIPVMLDLVNRINRASEPDHMFINQQSKRVILVNGILIDNGTFDKRELELSLQILLGKGRLVFHTINEQLSSNESPEDLFEKTIKYHEKIIENQNV